MIDARAAAPPTHRDILAVAVPTTLGYLTTPLVGLVDLAVVGRLGEPAMIGGVALGGLIFGLLFASFNFMRSGTTALVAQAYGRGDAVEIRAVLLRAAASAVLVAAVLLAISAPLLAIGLKLVGGSAAVQEATARYFGIRMLGAPFTLLNYVVLGWALGTGRAGLGLALQTLLNGLNIALALLFVQGLGWGIAGAAWGTVAAEFTATLAGLAVILAGRRGPWPDRTRLADLAAFGAMIAVNRDLLLRTFVLIGVSAFFNRQGAMQGDVVLAANAILLHLFMLGGFFLDGCASAAETFVGRAVGAGSRPAFAAAVRLSIVWGAVLAVVVAVLLFAAGPSIIAVMTTAEEVRATAVRHLPWAAATPIAGVFAFLMDGVFIGATWSRDMRNMMLLSLVVYLAAWAIFTPALGNDGLWLAFLIFLGVRGLLLGWIMRRRTAETFAAG